MVHLLQLWIVHKESVEQFVYLGEVLDDLNANKQYPTPV